MKNDELDAAHNQARSDLDDVVKMYDAALQAVPEVQKGLPRRRKKSTLKQRYSFWRRS
jgi:hypothetical protein